VISPLDAGAVVPTPEQALKDGLAKLAEDTDDSYAAAAKLLDGAHVADPEKDAKVLAAQASLEATWAQALADDADADASRAAELRADSERHLVRAEKFAKDARAKSPKLSEALVANADVMRLRKGHTSEIEKLLSGLDSPEALYVRGMLRWRDGKLPEATSLLTQALAGDAKLRARLHLGQIAFAAKQWDQVKTQTDAILAAQPAHARAKALAARVAAAQSPTVAAGSSAPAAPTGSSAPAVADPGTGPVTAGDYDGLVRKGDQLAENADCGDAIKFYEKALDARPGGVEALTGLGYCYLDRKEYARALASFRAALGISSRYGEAIIGMAEAYRFQGMKDDAVTYYRKYLDTNPSGSKATMAKRALDELAPSPAVNTTTSVAAPPPENNTTSSAPTSPPESNTSSSAPPPPPPPPPEKLPDKIPDAPVP
jgi:tetratricopeptide (TPR) repeat protein